MSEIEKMYELVGIKPICKWWCKRFDKTLIADCNGIYNAKEECSKCKHGYIESRKYPPFTTDKQLGLIKWLFNTIYLLCLSPLQNSEDFENDLAGLINSLWQDLPDEEKQQIKEILK